MKAKKIDSYEIHLEPKEQFAVHDMLSMFHRVPLKKGRLMRLIDIELEHAKDEEADILTAFKITVSELPDEARILTILDL